MAQKFCLDTSFLINGWNKRYRIDVFPSIWTHLDSLIADHRVISCHEVYLELQKQEDELFEWAKQRKDAFKQPVPKTIAELKKLMADHPNMAARGGSTNAADAWVIVEASLCGAAVVTDEGTSQNQRATKPPKIPDLCDVIGVPCMSPIEFFAHTKLKL